MSNTQKGHEEFNLEKYIKEIIKEEQAILSKEEIKEIVKELAPDLDELIAKKVKTHFKLLLMYATDKME